MRRDDMKRALDLKQLIFNLSSLVDLGHEVTSYKGFNEKMKPALYVVTGVFSVPKAALLLYSPKKRSLDLVAYKGLRELHEPLFSFQTNQLKSFTMNEPHDIHSIKKKLAEKNRASPRRNIAQFEPVFRTHQQGVRE